MTTLLAVGDKEAARNPFILNGFGQGDIEHHRMVLTDMKSLAPLWRYPAAGRSATPGSNATPIRYPMRRRLATARVYA